MIRKKTLTQITSRAIEYLEQNTDITMLSPGSTARALVDALGSEIAGLYTIIDRAMLQAYVSSASGVFLDLLGEMVGIRRRDEVAAYTTQSDRNVRFYVTSGSLDDYIANIPSGTTITTADGSVVFVVDQTYSIPPNATQLYVTARAQTVGGVGNVGAGKLVSHSIGSASVFVENREEVQTGDGIESDQSIRQRIRFAVRASEGSNAISVRLAALSVPGISDLIINEYAMGSGSFELIIMPQGNRVPIAALADVRSAVAQVVSFGVNFVIREPRYVPFSIVVELVQPSVPETSQAQNLDLASGSLQSYIGTLRPGDVLVVNRLREASLAVDSRIQDIKIIELRINGNPIAVSNYTLKPDEVFIPDPNMTEPFTVR